MEWMLLPDGVSKKVVYAGTGPVPDYPKDSKVTFHYRTFYEKDGREILLDDSKKNNEPFEMLIGKKFKLELWETLIKTMRVNEVATFVCDARHVGAYPVVAKGLRDFHKKKHHGHDHDEDTHSTHQCGFAALSQGLGYPDLDEYVKNPTHLTFQMEVTKVIYPGEYEPEVWSLTLDEKLKNIPKWKEEGNAFYKQGDLESACKMYSQAIGSLEQLMTREKPGTEEFLEFDHMKIPFLLNYAQCMLQQHEYYQAITHLTTVLEKDEDNVKALYRRGKAYQCVFDFDNSRSDYKRAKELDNKLSKTIDKELSKIDGEEKLKNLEDQMKYMNVFNKL